jgi:hypothetical protein
VLADECDESREKWWSCAESALVGESMIVIVGGCRQHSWVGLFEVEGGVDLESCKWGNCWREGPRRQSYKTQGQEVGCTVPFGDSDAPSYCTCSHNGRTSAFAQFNSKRYNGKVG